MATVPPPSKVLSRRYDFLLRLAFGLLIHPTGSAGACRVRVRPRRSRRRAGPPTGRGVDCSCWPSPFQRPCPRARAGSPRFPGESIPATLRRSTTPDDPSRLANSGASGAAPRPTQHRRRHRLPDFEAAATLHRPLSTLHDTRYRAPCKTRFRLAGCAFAGRESNPLDRDERFQFMSSPPPGLIPGAMSVRAHAEPAVAVPDPGGEPDAVRGAEVPRGVVPGTAAQHAPFAVPRSARHCHRWARPA